MEALTRRAADAPRSERTAARIRLAQFQLANGLDAESLGPMGAVLREDPNMRQDRQVHILRAIAQTMLRRSRDAETILAQPFLKDDPEAALWRAVTESRRGRFPQALAGLKRAAEIIDAYPDPLQGLVRHEVVRSALALRDVGVAERELMLLGSLAPRHIGRDEVEYLQAQLDEASGRPEAAMAGYKALFGAENRGVAARAQLRAVRLADRENDGSIPAEEALARLETVSFTWRGDEVEIEALGELGAIYLKQQRWRDAFGLARKANGFFPDHAITRNLHDEAARQFEELFTTGTADKLPRVDALALFYDFKEFLPIGRRGDEIIRRLADRLVELDLLDQAGELLQHQIDNRLTGAGRATVATRLAMIRLMSGKPAEALAALNTTRLPELPREVKRARQLLEAKALSDLSRTDLALEILASERGPEVDRLKADILWTARRWREAGEAHERILGDAWRGPGPLDERQRADAMRAGVAYVMADEPLSLDRLRAKYAAPMAQTPDARTFAFVTAANRAAPGDLRELSRRVANADTLTEFMAEYRKRYPDYASALRARQQKEAEGAAAPDAPATPPRQAETPPASAGKPG
jgi:tetratricopeptide (TPR) repeat protein